MASKTGNALLSLGLVLLVAVALWGVPKLPSLPESAKRVELPCKPPLSLLRWWDYDHEGTSTEYWHDGEFVANRSQLNGAVIQKGEPWVAWRGSFTPGEVQIYYGSDDAITAEQLAKWQRWVEECEAPNKVVFAPRSSLPPAE